MEKQFGDIDWQETLDRHRAELARAEQDAAEATAYAEKLRQSVPLLEQLAALHAEKAVAGKPGKTPAVPTTKPVRQTAPGRSGSTNAPRSIPAVGLAQKRMSKTPKPACAGRTSTSISNRAAGKDRLERIKAFLADHADGAGVAQIAGVVGQPVRVVGIALCAYAKAGHLARVGPGLYALPGKREAAQPPAPTELAQRVIEGAKTSDPGGHDLERVGTLKRCRKCGESHKDSFDFPVTCRAQAA